MHVSHIHQKFALKMVGKKIKCYYVVKTSKYRVWNWCEYIKASVWSAKRAVEVHGWSFPPSHKTSSLHTTNSELQKRMQSYKKIWLFHIILQLKKNLSPEWLGCCSALRHTKEISLRLLGIRSDFHKQCLWGQDAFLHQFGLLRIHVQVTLALMSHRLDAVCYNQHCYFCFIDFSLIKLKILRSGLCFSHFPPFELVVVTQVVLLLTAPV